MKKRAFTLIELLIVMSIISILSLISFTSYKYIQKINNEKQLKYAVTLCSDFLILSKNICRNQDKTGYVLYDSEDNALYLFCNKINSNSVYLPGKIKIENTNYEDHKINIDNMGKIGRGGTIVLKDERGRRMEVKIGVYTNYIREE